MLIDFHSHFLPRAFPALPDSIVERSWPRMASGADGRVTMMLGDQPFRSFEEIYWDVPKRLVAMDADKIDMQVISPLPEILSYWLNPAAGAVLCQATNRACADMVAQAPSRLKGLAILPLQDVAAALREIEVVGATPGMVGLLVGSNVNGVSIAAEAFDPVFAAAEQLGLIVFCHGIRPGGIERIEGPALMGAVIGIPQENMLAIASFIMRDVLGRFPRLKLVFSHGGGCIGSVIDRMGLVWSKFDAMRATLSMPPAEYARRFWYDTAVFGSSYLRYMIDQLGADRFLSGSDGPTEIGQKDLIGFIASTGIGPEAEAGICGGNAQALLATAAPARSAPD